MVASARALMLFCVAAVFASIAWAEDPPAFLLKWGVRGSADGEFETPDGIAVDSSGYVYVADYANNRVQKFTSDGVFVTKWGTDGLGDGQLGLPKGIAIDGRGVVYVAEYGNRRVQRFTREGMFLGYLVVWDFQRPWGVAVDRSDNVYVAAIDAHAVFKFASNGTMLTSWGTQGTGDGQFEAPAGVGVDANGSVYVSDLINSNVQKFTSAGVIMAKWTDAALREPPGLAVDRDGRVYVTTFNHRVLKLTSDGVIVSAWGRTAGAGSGDGEFLYPSAIVATDNTVYVVDGGNDRIQKFGYPVAIRPRDWGQVKATYR